MNIKYLTVCGSVLLSSAMTFGQPSAGTARRNLLDLENHWLQAEDSPEALESILADDFLHVVPQGIITKGEQLDFMRKHVSQKAPTKHFESLHVRIYGNVGIVNGMVVAVSEKSTERTWFTDVFAFRNGRWQAVSAQELPAGRVI